MALFNEDGYLNTGAEESTTSSSNWWDAPEPEWEWKPMERVESALQNSFGSLWSAASAVTDLLGMDDASNWTMNRSQELMAKAADHDLVNTVFEDIEGIGDFTKWAVERMTEFLPDIGMMALGGAGVGTAASKVAGTAIARKTTETMLKKGLERNILKATQKLGADAGKDKIFKMAYRETFRDAGALIGVSGYEGLTGTGDSWIAEIEGKGADASALGPLAVGAAKSAVSMFNPLNKVLAGKGLPGGGAVNILKMTGSEAAEEMGQEIPTMMHEAGLDPDMTFGDIVSSHDGQMRLLESGVAGALLGGTFGGGIAAINKKIAKKPEEVIIEEPEKVLEEAGVDTTKDVEYPAMPEFLGPVHGPQAPPSPMDIRTKGSAAQTLAQRQEERKAQAQLDAIEDQNKQIALQELEADVFKEFENFESPVPTAQTVRTQRMTEEGAAERRANREAYEERKRQEVATKEDTSIAKTLNRDIPTVTDRTDPQYVTDPEIKRKTKAARAIEAAGPWEGGQPTVEQAEAKVKKAKEKVKKAEAAPAKTLAQKNLKKKRVATAEKKVKAAEKVTEEVKKQKIEEFKEKSPSLGVDPNAYVTEDIKETVDETERAVDPKLEAERAAEVEAKQTKEQKKIIDSIEEGKPHKGWKGRKAKEGDTKIGFYTKGNGIIVKNNKDSWSLTLNEDGARVNRGNFNTLKDAMSAFDQGLSRNQFYIKDPSSKAIRKATKLTDEQAELVKSVNQDEIQRIAQAKTESVGDADAIEAISEGIEDAAKTFDPEKSKNFKTYAINTSIGFVKDAKKKLANIRNSGVTINSEGKATSKIETASNKTDVEDVSIARPTVQVSTATKGAKRSEANTFRLTQEENGHWMDDDGVSWGTKKAKAVEAFRKAKTPQVKVIKPKKTEATKATAAKKPEEMSLFELKKKSTEELTALRKDITDRGLQLPKAYREVAIIKAKEMEKKLKAEAANKKKAKIEANKKEAKIEANKKEADKDLSLADDLLRINPYPREALDEYDRRGFTDKEARKQLEEAVTKWDKLEEEFNKNTPDGLKALQYIAGKKHLYPKYGAVAEFLLANVDHALLADVPVIMGTSSYHRGGIVTIRPTATMNVYIHEIVHAITAQQLESNPEFNKTVSAHRKLALERAVNDGTISQEDANALSLMESSNDFNVGRDKNAWKNSEVAYGLLNNKEFLSQTYGSPEFRKHLKSIKLKNPKGMWKTLWDKVLATLGKALGLKPGQYTMLDQVITMVPQISKLSIDERLNRGFSSAAYDMALDKKEKKKKTKTRAEQVKIMMDLDIRDKPIEQFKQWTKRAGDTARDLGKGVTERLRKIDHTLMKPIRDFEWKILTKNREYQKRVEPFFKKYKSMPKKDRLMLDLVLMNREETDIAERKRLLKLHGMQKEYAKVEEVLAEIHKKKGQYGLNQYKDLPNYFPRRVKDVRELMRTMKGDPDYNVIQAELDKLGKKATDADKEKMVQSMINTGRFPSLALLKPTSSKQRKIDRVSSAWKHHYHNSQDALINHIYESNESIYAHEMLGDTHRKNLVQERDSMLDELLQTKKPITQKKRDKLVAKVQAIEDKLDTTKDEAFNDGIAKMLVDKAPHLNAEQGDKVIRLIRARLTQKGMHGPMATVRNVALMSALASPTSAITQIGDLAFSIYRYGPQETVKAILGDKLITAEDLDLAGSMNEFQSEGSAKALDNVLTWSGLKKFDRIFKETTMQASINAARKLSLEQFTKKYGEYYGVDTKQTWQDLKDNKKSKYTSFFAFNELSEFQPISMSEMPVKYLEAGNGRIFYALKSYNIKAINNVYREGIHKWRNAKTKADKVKALKDVSTLITLMVVAGATADELKDLLLGKDAGTFSEGLQDNLLKIVLLSRYQLSTRSVSQGFSENLLADLLIPPAGIVDDTFKDIVSFVEGDPDWSTIRNLPWGKVAYAWTSPTEEKKDMGNLKKQITELYAGGTGMGKLSADRNKYNAWARKNGEPVLTISSLAKAKREKDKE